VIRHLLGRGDVLTDCGLTSALPGTLMSRAEDVNCRRSMMARGVCPACGEKELAWNAHPKKLTGVADGRLTMNDVTAVFYLSCDYCSETLIPEVDLDDVARFLTEQRYLP
jgi:hypothetical protein